MRCVSILCGTEWEFCLSNRDIAFMVRRVPISKMLKGVVKASSVSVGASLWGDRKDFHVLVLAPWAVPSHIWQDGPDFLMPEAAATIWGHES